MPNTRVIIIPQIIPQDEMALFFSTQVVNNFLKPTRRINEIKNSNVDKENNTENFLRLRINKETIERIPEKIAQSPVIPNPIIRSV